jgi:hypothetical protein
LQLFHPSDSIYKKPIYRACDLDEQLDDREYGDNRGDMDNNEAKNTDVDETRDADRGEVQGADIGMAGGADNSAADDLDDDDEADDDADEDEANNNEVDNDIQEDDYQRIHHNDMPFLRSQIHPYLAIANALPKFTAHEGHLTLA